MSRSFTKMNRAGFARATREFEVEREPRFLPPPPAEKKRHDALIRKLKRRRGRPRVGEGAQRIQITVERGLLSQADRYAQFNGMSRSELIAESLRQTMSKKSA